MDRYEYQELATAGEVPPDVANMNPSDGATFLSKARNFEARSRGVVQKLATGFPWPTLVVFASVLMALAAVAVLTLGGHLSYWAAVPINGILIYYIFTPLHEAVHGNIAGRHRDRVWIEKLVGHVSGFVLLAPYPGFRALHLHHHANTNDPVEDPDYWVRSRTWLGQFVRSLVIQPVYILHLWKIARDPGTLRAFAWEMVYLFSYVLIVFVAWLLGFAREVLLLWILPGYIGVVLCPMALDWPVHHPHSGRGRYVDTAVLLFPRPFGLLMNVILSGHAYHLIHHLYPRLPFYRYGTAWRALKDELMLLNPLVRDFR